MSLSQNGRKLSKREFISNETEKLKADNVDVTDETIMHFENFYDGKYKEFVIRVKTQGQTRENTYEFTPMNSKSGKTITLSKNANISGFTYNSNTPAAMSGLSSPASNANYMNIPDSVKSLLLNGPPKFLTETPWILTAPTPRSVSNVMEKSSNDENNGEEGNGLLAILKKLAESLLPFTLLGLTGCTPREDYSAPDPDDNSVDEPEPSLIPDHRLLPGYHPPRPSTKPIFIPDEIPLPQTSSAKKINIPKDAVVSNKAGGSTTIRADDYTVYDKTLTIPYTITQDKYDDEDYAQLDGAASNSYHFSPEAQIYMQNVCREIIEQAKDEEVDEWRVQQMEKYLTPEMIMAVGTTESGWKDIENSTYTGIIGVGAKWIPTSKFGGGLSGDVKDYYDLKESIYGAAVILAEKFIYLGTGEAGFNEKKDYTQYGDNDVEFIYDVLYTYGSGTSTSYTHNLGETRISTAYKLLNMKEFANQMENNNIFFNKSLDDLLKNMSSYVGEKITDIKFQTQPFNTDIYSITDRQIDLSLE